MINVTRSYLPEMAEYTAQLEKIWQSGWLTNRGSLTLDLETQIKQYLDVPNLLFVNNGMIALQIAMKALAPKGGEVITTPFSYVATTNVILWEGCTPVFADIEPRTFCIDADKIEALITDKTVAILATHVYGFPCDVEKIEALALKYNLKVIYDGAHAFGVTHKGKSLLAYGDAAICSFHATKLFHTIEGGAIICNDAELFNTMKLFHQFGHYYEDYFSMGINGKVSEFHAAMGLCTLPHVPRFIAERRQVADLYREHLAGVDISYPAYDNPDAHNYAYFPVLFASEAITVKVQEVLKANGVNTRRYFYPALNELPFITNPQPTPICADIARRVLCLPFFPDLKPEEIKQIAAVIAQAAAM